ncbi:MAG TPA: ABC transporter substrate-binding protein [Verrucomicrobiae bacterium]|jgi:NitT/TauT family transport system substrate-binding protein|nr:ABC transporter substrate-binding protein [Verrucomicrobiae bacterium]
MRNPGFKRNFIVAMTTANLLVWSCAILVWGCKKGQQSAAPVTENGLTKIRVGYIGLTCEAPIYVAVERGFFKEEGLDPVLVKCDWSDYKDVMALGGFDITHHLVMYFLKPIEQGLDVKFTGGIHRGCLRVQAPANGKIKTVEDLRGKRIGVPGMGTPPFIFANRALVAHGIDPSREITWVVFPSGELGLALQKGDVDAVADSEPIGTLLEAQYKVKTIADGARDAPYKDEYCCEVIVNGKFLAANPKATAAATRALLKAAKWVQTNPAAAARLSVEKHYLASNPELNTVAISHLNYIPGIAIAEDSVKSAALAMKQDGMLSPSTDVDALAKRAFVHLPGVSDEWLNSLEVEKVAGGQLPSDENKRLLAELARGPARTTEYGDLSCCRMADK